MVRIKRKTISVIFCLVLMFATTNSFVNAINIGSKKEGDRKCIHILNSRDVISDEAKTYQVTSYSYQDAEKLCLDVDEEINIQNNGYADVDVTIHTSSPKLIDLYKKSLGVPDNIDKIDMEVPYQTSRSLFLQTDDGTIAEKKVIEPVRERFFEGVAEEQKFLYGFHITRFKGSRIYSMDSDREIFINVKFEALPRITDVAGDQTFKILTLESAPSDVINRFIVEQMKLSEVMMQSFSGVQIFIKNVKIKFRLPENAKVVDMKEIQKSFNFGSAYLNTTLSIKTTNQIILSEKWSVFEGQQITKKSEIDKFFKISYKIDSMTDFPECSTMDYDISDIYDEPWTWSWDWDIISLEGEEGGVSYSVDVDLYLTLSGLLHVDLGDSVIYADFGINAGLEVDATISGEFEKTWHLLGGMKISGIEYSWRGIQPMAVTPVVEPEAQLYVSVGGSVHIYINPEADFSLKAGGDLDFVWEWPPVHFTPIFDYSLGGSFDKTFELSCRATIKPSLGFALSLLMFEVIGPRITPTVYCEGEIGYDFDGGLYWKAVLGFDLYVGIQFTRFIHYDWPEPIYNVPIASWKGTFNPTDTTPPTTVLYMGPKVNGYVGPLAFFWFKAKDIGPEGEGVSTTKFRIPEASDNSWHVFDRSLTYLIITDKADYHVEYYSIDKEGNQEDTKTETVQADLTPPDIGIDFDGPYKKIGDNHYEVYKDLTIVSLVGRESGPRKTKVRVWFTAEHEGDKTEWNCTDFYGGEYWYGWKLVFRDTGRWTVTWVAEDGVWNVRCCQVTIDVKEQAYNIEIVSPKPGDVFLFNSYFLGFPYPFLPMYLLCTQVDCRARAGAGVAKVVFECGEVTDIDDSPVDDCFSGSLHIGSSGEILLLTLKAKAYDRKGNLVDEDSIKIFKIG
ncbi:MAG: hypothetical protein DRN25_03345 [Thermoplasmata archaeon]|nr:MAG: hypothetical protein DRN25_03345 [Thermoplasmata archaeon]